MSKWLHRALVVLIVGIVALGVFKPTKYARAQGGFSIAPTPVAIPEGVEESNEGDSGCVTCNECFK